MCVKYPETGDTAACCPLWLAPQGVNLIVERSRPAAPETVTEIACQQAEE